jgi:hypothetical protein
MSKESINTKYGRLAYLDTILSIIFTRWESICSNYPMEEIDRVGNLYYKVRTSILRIRSEILKEAGIDSFEVSLFFSTVLKKNSDLIDIICKSFFLETEVKSIEDIRCLIERCIENVFRHYGIEEDELISNLRKI